MIIFALAKTQYYTPEIPDYRMIIMQKDFLVPYREDKESFVEELKYAVEMFCAPNCFEPNISDNAIDDIAKALETRGSVSFEIGEDPNTEKPLLLVSFSPQFKKDAKPGMIAIQLWDMGYHASDRDRMMDEFGLTNEQAEAICKILQHFEDREDAGF